MKWIVILLALALALFGCKKNKSNPKMIVSGFVRDNSTNAGISGSTVKIYYKPYQNGVITSVFTLLTSTTTNSSGAYSFQIEKPSTSEFKFYVEGTDYIATEKIVNPDDLPLETSTQINFLLDATGTIQIHLKNDNPYDTTDSFVFQTTGLTYTCSSCCSNSSVNLIGDVVDTTYSCARLANRYLKYNYTTVKNFVSSFVTDSIYISKGSTAILEILY